MSVRARRACGFVKGPSRSDFAEDALLSCAVHLLPRIARCAAAGAGIGEAAFARRALRHAAEGVRIHRALHTLRVVRVGAIADSAEGAIRDTLC